MYSNYIVFPEIVFKACRKQFQTSQQFKLCSLILGVFCKTKSITASYASTVYTNTVHKYNICFRDTI